MKYNTHTYIHTCTYIYGTYINLFIVNAHVKEKQWILTSFVQSEHFEK
uniref:Uncharacterized protein n=1 Tax=Anguilla anguilla TaxID=7936 RepID=A0A0E9RWB3_ANGAN